MKGKIVKNHKSNWIITWFMLVITLLTMGFSTNKKAVSKVEELPQVVASQIELQKDIAVVTESAPETPVQTVAIEAVKKVTESIPATSPASNSVLGLKISAINMNIPLSKTTLDANRTLLVPNNPQVAAWYKSGPKFGEAGTALITGHYDSAAGPGVFFNLRNLSAGDLIDIKRDDGKTFTYEVDKLESYAQDHTFPWTLVYSTTGSSQLRLITCDGVYNPKTGRYSRNLVVYASLVP